MSQHTFTFPITYTGHTSTGPKINHVGDLFVEYNGEYRPFLQDEDKYFVEVTSIKWNGAELIDMFYSTQMDAIMEEIDNAAYNNFLNYIEEPEQHFDFISEAMSYSK